MIEPGILVGAGGVISALLRYLVYETIPAQKYPFVTLVVNILSSFILGIIIFAGMSDGILLIAGIGIYGTFTTYSTFAVDTVRLWKRGIYRNRSLTRC